MSKDYVAQALIERLRQLWFPLLIRRLRRQIEREYENRTPGDRGRRLWQPLLEMELPQYRLSAEERQEERQLLEELAQRITPGQARFAPRAGVVVELNDDEWPMAFDDDELADNARRLRRRLLQELELAQSEDVWRDLFKVLPVEDQRQMWKELNRLNQGFRGVLSGGKAKLP